MTVLLVLVAPIVLVLFLFAMEQVEATVLRRPPASTEPDAPSVTTSTKEADQDADEDSEPETDKQSGAGNSDTVD